MWLLRTGRSHLFAYPMRHWGMRQFYRPFAVILALSTFASPDAQPCCADAAGADRIAFVSQQSSVNHIYLMDIDASGVGANPARLTNDAEAENYPSWSPDGKRIAYQRDFNWQRDLRNRRGRDGPAAPVSYARVRRHSELVSRRRPDRIRKTARGGSDLEVFVMNIDGAGLQQLTSGANNADPVWSPDGTRITFGSDREGGNKLNIFAINADGSQQEQLTHFDVPYEAGDTNWSSDGKKIACEYDIDGMKQSDPTPMPRCGP